MWAPSVSNWQSPAPTWRRCLSLLCSTYLQTSLRDCKRPVWPVSAIWLPMMQTLCGYSFSSCVPILCCLQLIILWSDTPLNSLINLKSILLMCRNWFRYVKSVCSSWQGCLPHLDHAWSCTCCLIPRPILKKKNLQCYFGVNEARQLAARVLPFKVLWNYTNAKFSKLRNPLVARLVFFFNSGLKLSTLTRNSSEGPV